MYVQHTSYILFNFDHITIIVFRRKSDKNIWKFNMLLNQAKDTSRQRQTT